MASTSDRKPLIYEPYISRLTDSQKKIVEKEFLEVDEIRAKWIQELRLWIIRNPTIVWCRQDGLFLLRFLRYTKFARWCAAPVLAQEALVRYLAMRHIYPEWCLGLDPRGELMQKMIHDEVFTILGMDTAGQMIIWIRLGRFDVENLHPTVLLRYTIMFLEMLAEHEPVHIGGIKVCVDYKDTTWKHILRYNIDLLREFKKIVEKVMPVWIREVHNVGLPHIGSSYRTFLCELGTDMFKYKTYWHTSSADASKYFEETTWPEEYGGSCKATRQVKYLELLFEEKRTSLITLDRMDIDVELNDIRFFKPYYKGPNCVQIGGTEGEIYPVVNIESKVVKNVEFGKNSTKENVQSTTGATRKKAPKSKKKPSVKAKVDTGLKKTGKAKKVAGTTGANNTQRESLPGVKSSALKPWK